MAKTLPEYATRLTGSKFRPNNQRQQTDNAETSYEENLQFRFFDEWHDNAATQPVAGNNIIVYKFDATYPLNITTRVLELWSGSRTYQVYGTDGVTFAGTLVPQDKIYNVNGNLNEYIEEHPVTGVTISRYIGTASFTSTNPAVNGTAVRVAGATSQKTTAYTQGGEKAGVRGLQSFYLVLRPIDTNSDTSGMFRLQWEEKQEV